MVELAPEVDMAKLMAQIESGPKPEPGAAGGPPAGGAGTKAGSPPAVRNPFARPPVYLSLKAIEGVHDVYFVFKNDKAKAIQPLMSLSSIKFRDVAKEKE